MSSLPSHSSVSSVTATSQFSRDQDNDDSNKPLDDRETDEPSLVISQKLFNIMLSMDLDSLRQQQYWDAEGHSDPNANKVLPCLARLLLSPQFEKKVELLDCIYYSKELNQIVDLLSSRHVEPADLQSVPPTSEFEACDSFDKLRIVATECLRLQEIARQSANTNQTKLTASELFDCPIYFDTILTCLYALMIKNITIPIINILDVSEALLHIESGPNYILCLLANMPERCQELCHFLITSGERQDEATHREWSVQRAETLRKICHMNPSIAMTVRSTTLQQCKMPSLTILVTLDKLEATFRRFTLAHNDSREKSHDNDDQMELDEGTKPRRDDVIIEVEETFDATISFITDILLSTEDDTSNWFAQYTKTAQVKRIDHAHSSSLSTFRSIILDYMNVLFEVLLDEDSPFNSQSGESPSRSSEDTSSNTSCETNNKILVRATAALRFYCALRGIGAIKLNSDEADILLRMITCRPKLNQTSVSFATTGVCTLLACSAIVNNQKDEKIATEWLKWLIKQSDYSDTRYSSYGKCSISELLLLIAIHFQSNQTNQIADLVCTTLGMKLSIKASVSNCKSIFLGEVFNDQMIAEHAVRLPVTKSLDNSIPEFLLIHCVHQLLESRSFSKHQVPIHDWIYRQICESKRPMHNMLPKLIKAFVNSVIVSTSAHGHCGTNQPIPQEDIALVFKTQLYSVDKTVKVRVADKKKRPKKADDNKDQLSNENEPHIVDIETAQVLLLYYLLLYDETKLKTLSTISMERSTLLRYDPDLMMEIPIFYLLQVVRENQNSYGFILPDLLRLVTSQYPELCSIQHWLTTDHQLHYGLRSEGTQSIEDKINAKISMGMVDSTKVIKNVKDGQLTQLEEGYEDLEESPRLLIKAMEEILALPREGIWPFVLTFISNLHKIIRLDATDSLEYKRLIKVTTKLWWKFNTIFPRKLWVMTVNATKKPQANTRNGPEVKPIEHSWDELTQDPLIVLRCDPRIYRCASFLDILLHVLGAFSAASKRSLSDWTIEQPGRQKETRNLEELRQTLVLAQTSAAIQILLESCLPSKDESEAISKRENGSELSDKETILLDRFESSVDCICEHLHQVFIADTNLAKLVHFQTYSSLLLPITSEKIPSMHICLDFIPELLSQPDLPKQVFVIELTSYLCEKYAITKSLNVAKLCFNVAYTLLQLLPSERRAIFYIPVLPALLRICKVFPILREDANIILSQIDQITLAHMASTSSRLSLGAGKPFEGLERMNWREARKLMNSLGIHEALYVCIQKCSLDLRTVEDVQRVVTREWMKHNQQSQQQVAAVSHAATAVQLQQ